MELTFVTELGESFVVEIDPNMELENVMALLEAEVRLLSSDNLSPSSWIIFTVRYPSQRTEHLIRRARPQSYEGHNAGMWSRRARDVTA